MPVSGVVLTLEEGPSEAPVLARLANEPGVILGEREGRYLPIVLETATAEQGEDACERLLELPGVMAINVAFIDFSDAGD